MVGLLPGIVTMASGGATGPLTGTAGLGNWPPPTLASALALAAVAVLAVVCFCSLSSFCSIRRNCCFSKAISASALGGLRVCLRCPPKVPIKPIAAAVVSFCFEHYITPFAFPLKMTRASMRDRGTFARRKRHARRLQIPTPAPNLGLTVEIRVRLGAVCDTPRFCKGETQPGPVSHVVPAPRRSDDDRHVAAAALRKPAGDPEQSGSRSAVERGEEGETALLLGWPRRYIPAASLKRFSRCSDPVRPRPYCFASQQWQAPFFKAAAQDRRVPTSPAELRLSYAPIRAARAAGGGQRLCRQDGAEP